MREAAEQQLQTQMAFKAQILSLPQLLLLAVAVAEQLIQQGEQADLAAAGVLEALAAARVQLPQDKETMAAPGQFQRLKAAAAAALERLANPGVSPLAPLAVLAVLGFLQALPAQQLQEVVVVVVAGSTQEELVGPAVVALAAAPEALAPLEPLTLVALAVAEYKPEMEAAVVRAQSS